jgi:uncharacterized protein (TIGR03435 family)
MTRLLRGAASICVLSVVAIAADLHFEVATVRPNHTQGYGRFGVEGDRLIAQNQTLKKLLSAAYSLPEFQVQGPEWLGSERYDVTAQLPGGDSMLMLQTLLEERFQLQVRRGMVDMDYFALVEGKNGAKLKEYHAGDSLKITGFPSGARALTTAGPMSQLVEMLEPVVGRAVVDKTGLTGNYRVALAYTLPSDPNAEELANRALDIYTALQDQLGLKLEPQKGPVEILKIDHAEKVPTEN